MKLDPKKKAALMELYELKEEEIGEFLSFVQRIDHSKYSHVTGVKKMWKEFQNHSEKEKE